MLHYGKNGTAKRWTWWSWVGGGGGKSSGGCWCWLVSVNWLTSSEGVTDGGEESWFDDCWVAVEDDSRKWRSRWWRRRKLVWWWWVAGYRGWQQEVIECLRWWEEGEVDECEMRRRKEMDERKLPYMFFFRWLLNKLRNFMSRSKAKQSEGRSAEPKCRSKPKGEVPKRSAEARGAKSPSFPSPALQYCRGEGGGGKGDPLSEWNIGYNSGDLGNHGGSSELGWGEEIRRIDAIGQRRRPPRCGVDCVTKKKGCDWLQDGGVVSHPIRLRVM